VSQYKHRPLLWLLNSFLLKALHFIDKIVGNLQELFWFRLSWDSAGLPAV
jgi:hypothetical protein